MIYIDRKYKLIYEITFTLLAIIAVIITLLDLTETINLETHNVLNTLDIAILYIFIFDYVIRLILSKDKKDFFKKNIPDLIAIIPFNSLLKIFRIAKLLKLTWHPRARAECSRAECLRPSASGRRLRFPD